MQAKAELEAAVLETESALRDLQGAGSIGHAWAGADETQHAAEAGTQPVEHALLPQNILVAEPDAEQLPYCPETGAPGACDWAVPHEKQATAEAEEPDFAALAQRYPELRPYVRVGRNGRGSIDFTVFEAARCGLHLPASPSDWFPFRSHWLLYQWHTPACH